jgi:uncharacterized protein (UPF0254 family)
MKMARACFVFGFLATSPHAFAATYTNVTVTQVLSKSGTSGSALCYYFTLAGVTEADPSVPGNPWFAISTTSNNNAKEQLALILTARAAGTALSAVVTTGSADPACGNATISSIQF